MEHGTITINNKELDDYEIIYPTNFSKYRGCVFYDKHRDKWKACFKNEERKLIRKRFELNKKEDAYEYLMENSKHRGWVKNIVYKKGDDYYCQLTKGQYMKFSEESLDTVDQYIIYAMERYKKNGESNGYYAATLIGRKTTYFHNLVVKPNNGETIDHINRDTLDNRLENLRSVPNSIQSINHGIRCTNTTGVIGVHPSFDKYGKKVGFYSTYAIDTDDKRKYFSIREYKTEEMAFTEAVKHRQKLEETHPKYIYALKNTNK